MEFALLDGEDDGKHNDVSFVEISKILEMQDAFFFETEQFDRVRYHVMAHKLFVYFLSQFKTLIAWWWYTTAMARWYSP